jgi:hypothetical protein
MAQASTFRAFGAGKLTFDTASKSLGYFHFVRSADDVHAYFLGQSRLTIAAGYRDYLQDTTQHQLCSCLSALYH